MADRTIRVPMTAEIVVSRCVDCGVTYGVTADFAEDRRQDKRTFYCPNGHTMSYGENEADRLRRERDNLKQQMARVEEDRNWAMKRMSEEIEARTKVEREMKRSQRRVHAGVCPCCNRTFSQLSRHMQNKHPDVPFVPAVKTDPRKRVRA